MTSEGGGCLRRLGALRPVTEADVRLRPARCRCRVRFYLVYRRNLPPGAARPDSKGALGAKGEIPAWLCGYSWRLSSASQQLGPEGGSAQLQEVLLRLQPQTGQRPAQSSEQSSVIGSSSSISARISSEISISS